MDRIVLAYSGGLDTSVAVPWLADTYGAEIVALTLDLGQGRDLDAVRQRALAAGAARAHVLDVRTEFAEQYILPALQAGAVYEGGYPLATALGRPLIVNKLIEIARIEGAAAIAHGCTAKDNDQVRMEVSARALDPDIRIIAPARQWGLSRQDLIAYAHGRGIPVPASETSPYSTDANLWGRAAECDALEDPWVEPPPGVFTLTTDPGRCPDTPAYVEISFERGVPVSVNGVAMPFFDIIGSVGTIAGNHGVGRVDLVENRLVGIKSREVYEAPAAAVLHQAHRELEAFVSPRELDRVKCDLGVKYADLIYDGLWFSPLRRAIDAFVASSQERVTGTIRVKLYKGTSLVAGRQSPFALFDRGLATYGDEDRFDHRAAEGFIKIWGLPVETAARRRALTASPGTGSPTESR